MTEPSMVEKVARAIYEKRNGHGCKPWTHLPKAHQEPYRSDARAAIESIPDDDETFLAALSRRAHDARFGRPGETYPVLRNFIRALKDAALQEGKEGK